MSMHSISYQRLKLIIGQIAVVSIFKYLTHFVGYDVPEWMLLEQVDDCEQLSVVLSSGVWAQFSQTQSYM